MLRDSAYIDTSVLGAYYCPEPLSVTAEATLQHIDGPVISVLSEVEFCSLIGRKRRLRELTERQARAAIDLFASHVAAGLFRRISLDREHFLKARQLLGVMTGSLRTLDALHLAVAVVASLALVTADHGLAKAAKYHKCHVLLLK